MVSLRRLITELTLDSDPVAERVSIVAIGRARSIFAPFASMSHGFEAKRAAAMNFAASITLPPPTASMKSSFSFFIRATAFMQVSYSGFGSIPQNSKLLRFPSIFFAALYAPFFFALPPPNSIRTRAFLGM